MKVTIISLHPEVLSLGPRALSSCLKKAGYAVNLMFIPTVFKWSDKGGANRGALDGKHSEELISSIVNACKDSSLIGLSLVAQNYVQAVELTRELKERLSIPIIWGGPQPTAQPELCLQYADMVCLGEGDEAIVELCNTIKEGELRRDIPNIWFKKDEEIIKNDMRPLVQDLDSLPLPDFDILGQYIVSDNKLKTLDSDLLIKNTVARTVGNKKGVTYLVATSRGCPHKCTFCSNDMWRKLYPNQRYLRRRCPSSICNEIEEAIQKIPSIISVFFVDDNFVAIDLDQMKAFFEVYRKRINLPFSCTVSPVFVTQERLDLLMENGVFRLSMGIQSASPKTLDLYKRKIPLDMTERAIVMMEKNVDRMTDPKIITYHYIIDNPYETAEDLIKTFTFILDNHPRRNSINFFSLLPFPGTEMYAMMNADGLIIDPHKQIYEFDYGYERPGFGRYWYRLYVNDFPAFFLRFFLNKRFIDLMNIHELHLIWFVLTRLCELSFKVYRRLVAIVFKKSINK